MTDSPQTRTRPDSSPPTAGWVARHQLAAFFLLAFGGAWLLWLPGLVGIGGAAGFALLALGALAPFAAAVLVIRASGEDLRGWLRGLLGWRVPARFWIFTLGVPAALLVVVNAVLALTGTPIDLGLLTQRIPAYLAGFAVVATVGGGLEEPGWRGFALPRLQQRFSPLAATAILGLAWASGTCRSTGRWASCSRPSSPSTTPGCTTAPAACCCACCCTAASPRPST